MIIELYKKINQIHNLMRDFYTKPSISYSIQMATISMAKALELDIRDRSNSKTEKQKQEHLSRCAYYLFCCFAEPVPALINQKEPVIFSVEQLFHFVSTTYNYMDKERGNNYSVFWTLVALKDNIGDEFEGYLLDVVRGIWFHHSHIYQLNENEPNTSNSELKMILGV